MSNYLYIKNYAKKGRIGISLTAFDELVKRALNRIPDISESKKHLSKNQKFKLNRPVQVTISRGILHISIKIDVKQSTDIQKISKKIQEEISNELLTFTEQVPFDIQVKVISMF